MSELNIAVIDNRLRAAWTWSQTGQDAQSTERYTRTIGYLGLFRARIALDRAEPVEPPALADPDGPSAEGVFAGYGRLLALSEADYRTCGRTDLSRIALAAWRPGDYLGFVATPRPAGSTRLAVYSCRLWSDERAVNLRPDAADDPMVQVATSYEALTEMLGVYALMDRQAGWRAA